MTVLRKTIHLLFGHIASGESILLAASDNQKEVFDMALDPATNCGGRFNMLSLQSYQGLDFAIVAANEDDKAADDADALLERVLKAVKK